MFLFFLFYYLNCVIRSDVGSPPSQRSGALWVKLHSETYASASVSKTTSHASKHQSTTLILVMEKHCKTLQKVNGNFVCRGGSCVKLWLEHKHLHIEPPNCHPVPGWLLHAPNSYSSLTARGDSYVNFVTRCLLRGSVRVIGEEKYQWVSWIKWQSCCGWQFYWHSVLSTWIFVCLWTERIWQKAYNQWFLF